MLMENIGMTKNPEGSQTLQNIKLTPHYKIRSERFVTVPVNISP